MEKMRCCWPLVFLLLIQKVSLQDVQAYVGETITLPCLNSDKALQGEITVFWRFKDTITVYDIINSRASFDEQEASFRNRVEGFSAEWTKGNFSIKLSSVTKADGGTYTCFLPSTSAQTKVQLTVKDRPVPPTDSYPRNSDVRRRPDHILLFFAFLLGCSLLCA
ncbi:CD276 antigen homolog isoform X1 [Colossoma macropomum]|uniref:CD276 antigen homolog isoform X1 n=2 Tax=Colossoma macropomum TaxID=42526 RepID=UPI001863A90E|nr:CD276 antigen homolog isoform X1 [Colossoma macropomum]